MSGIKNWLKNFYRIDHAEFNITQSYGLKLYLVFYQWWYDLVLKNLLPSLPLILSNPLSTNQQI